MGISRLGKMCLRARDDGNLTPEEFVAEWQVMKKFHHEYREKLKHEYEIKLHKCQCYLSLLLQYRG